MLKLTKTGIGLLTKQYRSVLRKCLLLNLGLFTTITSFTDVIPNIAKAVEIGSYAYSDATGNYNGWNGVVSNVSRNPGIMEYYGNGYQTISSSYSIIQNLEAIDRLLGSYPVQNIGQLGGPFQNNWNYVSLYRASGEPYYHTIAPYISIISNLSLLDYALGTLPSGRYVSNMKSMGDNVKALDDALYNYYYTFRVDERDEVIDYTSFFQKDFSTLQEVDLQSKNPTHLGAFAKCDEACPRPSERFASSLSQEQMFKNNASVDAGTFSICNLQIENVNEKLSNVFEA